MYIFGSGTLIAKPTSGTPMIMGTLQEVQLDIDQTTETLHGQNKFPEAVAQSIAKVTGKAKVANFDINMPAGLLFNTAVNTGYTKFVLKEAGSVPASSTYTITVANAATFNADWGVILVSTGVALTKVASAPAAGQYSVNETTGVYTFNSAQASAAVLINYTYTVSGSGHKTAVTNTLMGIQPVFSIMLNEAFTGQGGTTNNMMVHLKQCVASKFNFPFKNTSFAVQEFEFQAFADATGSVLDIHTSE